jgi:hypothetical protein
MESQVGMSGTSGIAGMASGLGTDAGPLFIETLYSNSAITSPVFAFWLGSESQESFCDIGSIFDDAMKTPTDLVYIDALAGDNNWTNYIT